jgi:hypothetical protein
MCKEFQMQEKEIQRWISLRNCSRPIGASVHPKAEDEVVCKAKSCFCFFAAL